MAVVDQDDNTATGTADPAAGAATGAATGAASGAMVGGPVGALGGAGIGAIGGLFNTLLQQQAAKDAFNRNYAAQQHDLAQARVAQTQDNQVNIAARTGQEQQSALGQLIAAISRTVR